MNEQVAKFEVGDDDHQREGESGMAFAIRLIQAAAWDEGFQAGEDSRYALHKVQANPYRDGGPR